MNRFIILLILFCSMGKDLLAQYHRVGLGMGTLSFSSGPHDLTGSANNLIGKYTYNKKQIFELEPFDVLTKYNLPPIYYDVVPNKIGRFSFSYQYQEAHLALLNARPFRYGSVIRLSDDVKLSIHRVAVAAQFNVYRQRRWQLFTGVEMMVTPIMANRKIWIGYNTGSRYWSNNKSNTTAISSTLKVGLEYNIMANWYLYYDWAVGLNSDGKDVFSPISRCSIAYAL